MEKKKKKKKVEGWGGGGGGAGGADKGGRRWSDEYGRKGDRCIFDIIRMEKSNGFSKSLKKGTNLKQIQNTLVVKLVEYQLQVGDSNLFLNVVVVKDFFLASFCYMFFLFLFYHWHEPTINIHSIT